MYLNTTGEPFREPQRAEKELLWKLLQEDFPGVSELREQLAQTFVSPIDENGSLSLATTWRYPAAVSNRIPVEASYIDSDGVEVYVLLHVVSGYLDELEVYRADSRKIANLPTAQAIAT